MFIEIGNQLSCVPMPRNHFEIGMSKRKKKKGAGGGGYCIVIVIFLIMKVAKQKAEDRVCGV